MTRTVNPWEFPHSFWWGWALLVAALMALFAGFALHLCAMYGWEFMSVSVAACFATSVWTYGAISTRRSGKRVSAMVDRIEALEKAVASDARLTDSESGTAIGSAEKTSSLLLTGIPQEPPA
jgi:hypothetical protein